MGMGDDINAIIRTCPPPRDGESEVGKIRLSPIRAVQGFEFECLSLLHSSVGVPSERCHPGGMGWQFGRQAVLRRLQLRDHHQRECPLLRRLGNAKGSMPPAKERGSRSVSATPTTEQL